jgi:hypothetical protein
MSANIGGVIVLIIKYIGKIIEAGNNTLPVVIPRINPATMQSVKGESGIEAIKSPTFEDLKIFKNTNIPRIINVKFHGFIFRAVVFRFKLILLNTKERRNAVLTPMSVAIS